MKGTKIRRQWQREGVKKIGGNRPVIKKKKKKGMVVVILGRYMWILTFS